MRQAIDPKVRDAILASSLKPAPSGKRASDALVWRWLPWLLSFGGIRATDILRAKGEDFLHVTSNGETEVPTFHLRSARRNSHLRSPIHPGLVEMGFLEMAREHAQVHPFLDEGDAPNAAEAALERYRRKLKNTGLLDGQDAGLSISFRAGFRSDLRRAGVNPELIDVLLCRVTEPSEIDHGSGAIVAAARELAKLELPALPTGAEAVAV